MSTDVLCQRHRDGRQRFVPADPIETTKYEVAEIKDDGTAKAFVEQHHYSRSFPAARLRYGLYRAGALVGVAVYSHPPSEAVLARLPCDRLAGVELGRFVLLDGVPGNGESWFLAQTFAKLRRAGIEALVSHSDPVPRHTAAGHAVMPGHVGIIYQATNAVYGGRTRQQVLCLLPDGTCFSERSMSKIRSAERGWERDVTVLVAAGADMPIGLVSGGEKGDPRWLARRDWMWSAIRQVCRRIEHRGNHRYYWAIDKRLRKQVAALASGAAYPKHRDEEDHSSPAS